MKVYLKNCKGEQTIRDLSFWDVIYLRLYQLFRVKKEERAIVKFLV